MGRAEVVAIVPRESGIESPDDQAESAIVSAVPCSAAIISGYEFITSFKAIYAEDSSLMLNRFGRPLWPELSDTPHDANRACMRGSWPSLDERE